MSHLTGPYEILEGGADGAYRGRDQMTREPVFVAVQEMNTASMFAAATWMNFTGGGGVPSLRWIGHDSGKLVLVTDPLGPSLEDLHQSHCEHELPPINVVATQLLARIQMMHKYSFVHGALKPTSFSMGHYEWQRQQVLLCDFRFNLSAEGFVQDLRQIGLILAYLYGNDEDWSVFVARTAIEQFRKSPPQIHKYMDLVNTDSHIDYTSLRAIFTSMQSGFRLFPAMCTSQSCLYEKLHSCLRRIGMTVQHPVTPWCETTGIAILQGQSQLLSIYLDLLSRDNKKSSCRQHSLRYRFWRDIQWLIKLGDYGPLAFRTQIIDRVYKFMTLLAETTPYYRRFWTEKLLYLANQQQMSNMTNSKGWQRAALHWKDEINSLRAIDARLWDADLVDFSSPLSETFYLTK